MPKLCITGTRYGRHDFVYWADRWVRKFGAPTVLIVGDCEGRVQVDETGDDFWQHSIDEQAYDWGKFHGFNMVRELVKMWMPSPQRFHERDQRMADHLGPGDWCLGLPVPGSRGTHLTMSMCRKRGANVFECPLRAEVIGG